MESKEKPVFDVYSEIEAIRRYKPASTFTFPKLEIKDYPENLPSGLVITLIGPQGSGKSSLVNSLNYVFQMRGGMSAPRYLDIAAEGPRDYHGGGTTKDFNGYYLTKNIKVFDIRGLPYLSEEFSQEVEKLYDGAYNDGEEVKYEKKSIPQAFKGLFTNEASKTNCPVVVLSAIDKDLVDEIENLQGFFAKIKEATSVYPLVVLTKEDLALQRNEDVASLDGMIRSKLGVERVTRISNYTKEDHHPNEEKTKRIIEFMGQCTLLCDSIIKKKSHEGGCVVM
ncbi:uncharacterized protein LOC117107194 [Anneissia japonica]|uniref:uncharacterized protein LOC117107194 n=1 Tax=Anneissia japonica TaxID=1529436 RepID=UPI0014257E82|nr:uncharacterized protein LOC117107194 [Anneissia japonica]